MNTPYHTQPVKSGPVTGTWICLISAWVFFLLPIPFSGLFVGWPLNLVAFILAIVVMACGRTTHGLLALIASIVVSPIVYFLGWVILGLVLGTAPYQEYLDKAKTRTESAIMPANEPATETTPAR